MPLPERRFEPAVFMMPNIDKAMERRKNRKFANAGFFTTKALSDSILNAPLIGQDEAVYRICSVIAANSAERKRKHFGAFLLVGNPGTGKTELTKLLAKAMNFHFENFSLGNSTGTEQDLAPLFGVPDPYQGAGHGRLITAMQQNPKGVVFNNDEFEKALKKGENSPLATAYLGVLNDGIVNSTFDNSTHSAANAVYTFTSNFAAKEMTQLAEEYADMYRDDYDPSDPSSELYDAERFAQFHSAAIPILHANGKGLPMALLSRFGDNIIPMRKFSEKAIMETINAMILSKIQKADLKLKTFDDEITDKIRDSLSDEVSGRDINNKVESQIMSLINRFKIMRRQSNVDADGIEIGLVLDPSTNKIIVQAVE